VEFGVSARIGMCFRLRIDRSSAPTARHGMGRSAESKLLLAPDVRLLAPDP
jgi:hypothetical protein